MTQDEKEKLAADIFNAPHKDKEAISAAFDDMAMYGRGFTRMTAEGIEHIPYREAMKRHSFFCETQNAFRSGRNLPFKCECGDVL